MLLLLLLLCFALLFFVLLCLALAFLLLCLNASLASVHEPFSDPTPNLGCTNSNGWLFFYSWCKYWLQGYAQTPSWQHPHSQNPNLSGEFATSQPAASTSESIYIVAFVFMICPKEKIIHKSKPEKHWKQKKENHFDSTLLSPCFDTFFDPTFHLDPMPPLISLLTRRPRRHRHSPPARRFAKREVGLFWERGWRLCRPLPPFAALLFNSSSSASLAVHFLVRFFWGLWALWGTTGVGRGGLWGMNGRSTGALGAQWWLWWVRNSNVKFPIVWVLHALP